MEIKRKKHFFGYIAGSLFSASVLICFSLPSNAQFHARGEMNSGHEKLKCEDCHIDSKGTLRQQLQANLRYLFGQRRTTVEIGYQTVKNRDCIACHERPDDNHPVYRFIEPKFSEVRRKLQPHKCVTCHLEHQDRRVTVEPEFCQHCHAKLKIKNDTISEPHEKLVKAKRWQTCLGCHDFHGNHEMKLNTKVNTVIARTRIESYFNGASSPYPGKLKHRAKSQRP